MKLQLRYSEEGPSGGVYVLTDEEGHPLPGQQSIKVKQHCGKLTTITAVFVVVGPHIAVTQESVVPEEDSD